MSLRKNLGTLMFTTVLATGLVGCGQPQDSGAQENTSTSTEQMDAAASGNILLQPWKGNYGGVPAFDKMTPQLLQDGISEAIARSEQVLWAAADNPGAPTFENTVLPFETYEDELWRLYPYYFVYSWNLSSQDVRPIIADINQQFTASNLRINQNEKLAARIFAYYESDEAKSLSEDKKRLLQQHYERFALNGGTLKGAAKERYAEIETRLTELETSFRNNVLADEEERVVFLTKDQLDGLPDGFVKSAAAAAEARGKPGEFAVTNTRSSMAPFLTYSTHRKLREQVWKNYYTRAGEGSAHDNKAVIKEILELRHERVGLLGYETYADWQLSNRMAKKPENAQNLMMAVWPHAIQRVKEEVADMQAVADGEGANIKIEPWDYRFYAEKVRLARYDLSSEEVKQYFQLDKLQDAMFYVAGELFNFSFSAITDGSVPVYHEDMTVYEVKDRSTGDLVGLWYLDPFARKGKRSGAWAVSYRPHQDFRGKALTLTSNNSNFVKGAPGEPVLISHDDAETFFHEFGHALHALSSNVKYPGLNNGVRDYTEFHSQLLERWLLTEPVINSYLVHHETGAPIPADLIAKMERAANFNQGFATTEYLASALVDMAFHTTDPADIGDPYAFADQFLASIGMPSEVVMRHRTPHFSHIFSSEGYSAGYYGYMWADVLTSDAAEAFAESPGGFYDPEVASKMVKHLFAPRNAVDPAAAYRAFRGRDAGVDALMRDRGFTPAKDEASN